MLTCGLLCSLTRFSKRIEIVYSVLLLLKSEKRYQLHIDIKRIDQLSVRTYNYLWSVFCILLCATIAELNIEIAIYILWRVIISYRHYVSRALHFLLKI